MSESKEPAKKLAFSTMAIGIPSVIGVAAILWLMFKQERLILGPDRSLALQPPPIYLEEPGHEISGQRYLFDQKLGWRNIPNLKSSTYGKQLTINSRGLRDREYDYERTPGGSRILVLGDSYAWGYGVGDDEVFSEVLEQNLGSGKDRCEVINTGVSGWGTDQELIFFRSEGVKYRPDVVVLAMFVQNDPINNVALVQYFLGKPCFTSTNLTQIVPPVVRPGVKERWLEERDALGMTGALVTAIQEECRKIDARLVLMTFGQFGRDANPFLEKFEKGFAQALRSRLPEVSLLDVDRKFSERAVDPRTVADPDLDMHWNAAGHKIVAELLEEHLAAEGLLTPVPSGEQ
ncbi:MAG: lysophospholipase L1-like esterase [Limisphaerales bacterium]|jgi:lysophospholipase L1-like esterase